MDGLVEDDWTDERIDEWMIEWMSELKNEFVSFKNFS